MNDERSGDNRFRPVEVAAEEARDMLAAFETRRGELLRSLANARVASRATAGDAIDLIGVARDVGKLIDTRRLEISAPYRDAADGAKAIADKFWEPVEREMTRVLGLVTAFNSDRDARIAAQRAEQEALERRVRQAAADVIGIPVEILPPSAPAPRKAIRGDMGKRLVTRTRRIAHLVDVTAIPDFIRDAKRVREAMEAVATDMAKNLDAIAGFELTEMAKDSVT